MRKAWQRVKEIHGVALPFRDYERHLGREFGDIMQRLGLTDTEAVRQTYEAESVATAHLAEEFSRHRRDAPRLRGRRLAAGRRDVQARRPGGPAPRAPRMSLLDHPHACRSGPDEASTPDPLLLALVDLGVDPASAVYVGDMAVDQESAARAGCPLCTRCMGLRAAAWAPGPETAASPKELLSLLLPPSSFVEGSTV